MKLKTDGYFCEDQIVFDDCGRGSSVAKGFAIQSPSIEHASVTALNALEDELRVLLRSLKGDAHYQFRFVAGGNYRREFLDYYDETDRLQGPESSRTLRNRKFTYYWHQLEGGMLRRDQLQIYVNLPAFSQRSAGYRESLASSAAAFEQYRMVLEQVFRRFGGDITPLSDDEHFADFLKFFNPSRAEREHELNVLDSIQENCFLSEAAPVKDGSFGGFWMDGQYHGMLVIKSLPQATFSGMIGILTGLPLLDYSITVNVRPLDISTEIRREEAACEKLSNALRHNPKERMRSTMEARELRIRRLMSDEVVPFKAQFILRAWSPTLTGLQAKLAMLESAVVKLHGANYYAPAFPPTARNYFLASMPGWTRDRYDDHSIFLEDHHLANLLPVSASPTGHLENAEAIYPGNNGNIIGIRTFLGQDASPQHALVTGMTGAGKSMLLSDLLLQTEPYYTFTAIVDDGMAHARYIESVSDQPTILIQPEGNITFNYLDTNGLPLSPQHLGDAAAMITIMTRVEN
ncbi:MAG: hypothetical protein KDN22_10095 [Verrucomicrobiae bacterium]|nr:hypothetical protein [Verrucomicrobiae bacterium]